MWVWITISPKDKYCRRAKRSKQKKKVFLRRISSQLNQNFNTYSDWLKIQQNETLRIFLHLPSLLPTSIQTTPLECGETVNMVNLWTWTQLSKDSGLVYEAPLVPICPMYYVHRPSYFVGESSFIVGESSFIMGESSFIMGESSFFATSPFLLCHRIFAPSTSLYLVLGWIFILCNLTLHSLLKNI